MLAGSIEIQLMANLARIQADMDRATRIVGDATSRMGRAAGMVAGALGAIAGALSVAAFSGWIKGAIDAADAASKLSAKTGIAVKDIAGLELAYELAGLGGDALSSSMSRLSKGMVDGNKAMDALGIKSKNLDGTFKSNKDVLYAVADSFKGLNDGAQKTALALELFGKSGADMIPLLNGGSEGMREMDDMARKLGLTISEDAAKHAEQFNDTMDLIGKGSLGVARGISAELLPTLSALAGSFLSSMTEGDKLKNTAQFLASGLKLLYTVGVGVVEVFSTVGKTIGAAGAQIVAILSGEFKLAHQIGLQWSSDIGSSWAATARSISTAWDTSGNATVEAMTKTQQKTKIITEGAANDSKKAVAAIAKEAEAYASLLSKINGKETGQDADFQKNIAILKTGYDAGRQSLVDYIATVEAYIGQQKSSIDIDKLAAEESEFYAAAMRERDAAAGAAIKSAMDEADANEMLARTFGLSKSAIEAEELARLELKLAQADNTKGYTAEIYKLEELIEAKRRSVAAGGQLENMEAAKKASDDMAADWQKSVEQYDDVFRKGFANMVNGGKGTWKAFTTSLVTTFRTSVADQIYKMFAQPFVVKMVASLIGMTGMAAAGVAGAAQSGGGSIASSMLGSVASSYAAPILIGGSSIAAIGSSVATGVSAGMAGTSVAGAASAYGAAGMTGVSTGLTAGSAVGTTLAAIPVWGWVAMAVVALYAKFGGRGEKEIKAQGFEGNFGKSGFAGNNFTDWEQDGGWFHSDRSGHDPSPLAAGMAKQLDASFSALKNSASGFAKSLSLPTEQINDYSKRISVALTKDEAKNQEAINAMFAGMGEEMARSLLTGAQAGVDSAYYLAQNPDVANNSYYKSLGAAGAQQHYDDWGSKEGRMASAPGAIGPDYSSVLRENETYSAALQRLSVSLSAVNGMLDTLDSALLDASVAGGVAASALVDLFGGLDAMKAVSAGYFANYYSEQEKVDVATRQLGKTFADLGYVMPAATEAGKAELRARIEAQDLTTEAGRKTRVELMGLSGSLSALTTSAEQLAAATASERRGLQDQLDELTMTSAQLLMKQRDALDESNRALFDNIQAINAEAAAIQIRKDVAAMVLANADSAFGDLQKAVQREKSAKAAAHETEMKAIQLRMDASSKSIAVAKSLSDALRGALGGMQIQGAEASDRASAQAQISAALAIARASGVMPSADSLKGALSVVGKDASSMYATIQDYQRDFYRTANDVDALGKLSDIALSVEEKTLAAMTAQQDSAQLAYEAEVMRLDAIVTGAQAQLDVLKGIKDILSVEQAAKAFNGAVGSVTAMKAANNPQNAPAAAGMATVRDYAKQYGGDAYHMIDAINGYSAKLASATRIAALLGKSADAVSLQTSGHSLAYWEEAQRQYDAGMHPTTTSIKGFANGGDHMGGLRWVGELGPEVEATGASRIHSTRDLMSSLRNPANNNAELVAELREQRKENAELRKMLEAHLYAIAKNTLDTADFLDGAVNGETPILTAAA